MSESSPPRLTPRLILGLGVLAIGLLFTADSLGFGDADLVFDYWPILLIAIGATKLGGRTTSDKLFAGIWIGIGLWLLAWNLDYVEINPIEFFWPFVLILFGLSLIFGALRRRQALADGDSTVNVLAVMGGVERQISSQAFEGGDVTAFMGGGRLDLRQARLASDEVELQLFAMWGGYELRVPPDWDLSMEVLPLLGAAEDKRTHQEKVEGAPRLVLKGVVIMGGIEVKN